MSASSREVGDVLAYRTEKDGEYVVGLLLLEFGAVAQTDLTQEQAVELSLALRDLASPDGVYDA